MFDVGTFESTGSGPTGCAVTGFAMNVLLLLDEPLSELVLPDESELDVEPVPRIEFIRFCNVVSDGTPVLVPDVSDC